MWGDTKTRRALTAVLTLVLIFCLVGLEDVSGQPRNDRPPRGGRRRERRRGPRGGPQQYSIEQAVSDRAQLTTIGYSALAFCTGTLGADSVLPPGKVCDYFGFQYLRDNDAGGLGHNPAFVPRVADNVLYILNDDQVAALVTLATTQAKQLDALAYQRFPLMKAFRRQAEGDMPKGSGGLSKSAVMDCSAEVYRLDAAISIGRAKLLGEIVASLDARQKAYLSRMKPRDSSTWPQRGDQIDRRRFPHNVHVAVMTYASELFSWHVGSAEADTYFCPERHGMYFGTFYMKRAPGSGKENGSINTNETAEKGEAFLAMLTVGQRALVTQLVDLQRQPLRDIVATRRAICTELRESMRGRGIDENAVMALATRYGQLDGEISYLYATRFAKVYGSLTAVQKSKAKALRGVASGPPDGAYLYSRRIAMPTIRNTDVLFQ